MSLIAIILSLAVAGFVLWLIEKYIPMDATIKVAIRIIVLIVVVIWLLQVLHLMPYLTSIRV